MMEKWFIRVSLFEWEETAYKMVYYAVNDLHEIFLWRAISIVKNKSYQQNIYHALSWL